MGSLDDEKLVHQRRWIVHLVSRAMRAAGATEVVYDEAELLLRYRAADGSAMSANLVELFDDCVGAGADDRAASISRFVATLTSIEEMPSGWEQVRERLRPVVRPASYARRLETPLSREFLPFLTELVVVDQPRVMAYVTAEHLRTWGVTEAVVFDLARANLAARVAYPPVERDPEFTGTILQFEEQGDDYWGSNLLLDGWLAGLAEHVGGRPVAFVPETGSLTVADDDPEAIGALLEMIEKRYLEAPRPISPQAYTVDGAGRVVPYAVPAGDGRWNAVHRSEVLLASREYAAQREQLADVDGPFVASLMVKELPAGRIQSVTVWGDGVDTLLPRADFVAFASETSEPFTVPWEVVEREAGLAPDAGWSPARYRVRAWPGPAVLARLRAAAISL